MFEIKTKGKKIILKESDPEDIEVREAIYTIYNGDYSFMILINWNNFEISMDGVSFSQIYDDVVNMLEFINLCEEKFSISFLDSCFTTRWHFSIKDEIIKVVADWIDIASYGNENITLENLKKVSDTIIINKNDFKKEWNNLLKIIKQDLISAGYDDRLEGFEYLHTLN